MSKVGKRNTHKIWKYTWIELVGIVKIRITKADGDGQAQSRHPTSEAFDNITNNEPHGCYHFATITAQDTLKYRPST
jgi:hypothetical protein